MWALRTILFVAVFSGGCVFALINPIIGAVTYMMVYQVTPNARWWGMPLADMGFRFSFLAGLFTVIGLFVAPHRVPRPRSWITLWECGLILLTAIAALNTFVFGLGASSVSYALFDKLWKMMLFLMVLNCLAGSRRNLHIIIWTLVIGSLYLGHDAYNAPRWEFAHGRIQDVGGPDFRTTSGLGAHMGAMIPLIGVAFLAAKQWPLKVLAAVSAAFTVNAIILCRTRSAFVGLAVGALAAVLMAPKAKRYRIHLMLVIGALLAFSLTDVHFWNRMATMSSKESLETDIATVHRVDIWRASGRILADYPQGIGMGNFPSIIGSYDWRHPRRGSHNTLIVAFVELGFQGGMLFLVMTCGTFYVLWRSARLADLTPHPMETKLLIYGALVSFVTYFVAGMGTERLYCESFWWVMAIPHWIHRVVTTEIDERVPALARTRPEPLDDADALLGQGYHGHPTPPDHPPRPSFS
jgi:putative inorganic carbon (HCO3(-)) transporter